MTHRAEAVATVRTLVVVGRTEVVEVRASVERSERVAGRLVDRERRARGVEVARVARGRAAATVRQVDVTGRAERARREVTVALQHFVVVADTGIGRDVAAAVFGVDAHEDVELGAGTVGDVVARQPERGRVGRRAARDDVTQLDGAVAFEAVVVLVEAVLRVELHAFEVFLHDEVDDAADRVRTVDGRGAAGQDFDALDHGGRDLVQVGRRVGDAAVRQATTVDEDEGAGRAEAAQVDRCGTRRAVGDVRVLRSECLRQLVDQVFNARDALRGDVGAGDLRHGAGALDVRHLDAGTGDDDLFDLGVLRVHRQRAGACQCADQKRMTHRASKLIVLLHYENPPEEQRSLVCR